MSTRQRKKHQQSEGILVEERQLVKTVGTEDFQAQGEGSGTSQTALANEEYQPQLEESESSSNTDNRDNQDHEMRNRMSSGHSEDALDKMLQIMLERERVQEEREQQRKEEERRRREEELLQEERRREEEQQRRQEDNRRWEELLRTVLTSTSRMSVASSTSSSFDKLRDVPKLPKLQDSDDIEAYLYTFERHMETYKVERTYWVAQLAPLLRGMAQKAYMAVPRESSNDYQEVKEAILRRYDIGEDTYRQRFAEAVPQEKESFSQFSARVGDLLDKWARNCLTGKDWRELIGTERVLSAMPNNVQAWVRDKKPKSLVEAGKLADDYMRNRKLEYGAGNRQFKRNDDRPGGRDRDRAPREKREEKPTASGGVSKDASGSSHSNNLSKKFSKSYDREKGPLCFSCKKWGHISAQCPSKTENANYSGQWQKEEDFRRAIIYKGSIEGKKAPQLRVDSGADRTLVHPKWIPEGAYLGKSQRFRNAWGDIRSLPLAGVQLAVGGKKYSLDVAVTEGLAYDALLGRDIPELNELSERFDRERAQEALAVTTRARAQREARESEELQRKQLESGVQPHTLEEVEDDGVDLDEDQPYICGEDGCSSGEQSDSEDEENAVEGSEVTEEPNSNLGDLYNLDPSLFLEVQERNRLTKSEKRKQSMEFVKEKEANLPERMSREQVEKAQKSDPTLAKARRKADIGEKPYHWQNGLLFRESKMKNQEEPQFQIVLPSVCRESVLTLAHSAPLAGHFGRRKTTERILKRFFWPGVCKEVRALCRSCPKCQKTAVIQKNRAPLKPLPIIDVPFLRIAMDIVGPLVRTDKGNRYVLVVMDYATRWPEAVALKSVDSETVARALVELFARVGIPKEILTDQGSNFVSRLMTEFYRLTGVTPIKTSVYHPQTDGMVERFNATLKRMLRKSVAKDAKDWDQLLPFMLFAYRGAKHATTGFSPHELVYGRQMRDTVDILAEQWKNDESSEDNVTTYLRKVQERFQRMKELVNENEEHSKQEMKKWYDRKARQRSFREGDQVLVLLPSKSNKLLTDWMGPYTITKRISDVNYEVDMADRAKQKRTFHINALKEWHSPVAAALLLQEEVEVGDELPTWKVDDVPVKVEDTDHLTEEQRQELDQLLSEFQDVLSDIPGRTDIAHHEIRTNARPIRLPPYRLPQAMKDTLQQEIKEMLKHKIIEPSKSEWASPVILVPKKDGTKRLCIDFRKLNSVSEADPYPIPRVDELIDRLGKAKFITTLDLTKGYWQIPVAPESQDAGYKWTSHQVESKLAAIRLLHTS